MAIQTITTILTPPASYNLVDLQTCKDELEIESGDTSDDNYINLKIAQFSTAVQSYCNRAFVMAGFQDYCIPDRMYESFRSEGNFSPLQLSQFPVTEVSSVVVTWDASSPSGSETLTANTDFLLDGNKGWLHRLHSTTGLTKKWKSAPITVQYTAGYATVPGDVVNAVVQLVASAYQQRGRDQRVKETDQQGGVGRVVYWIPNTPAGALPPSVTELLDFYRPFVIPP